MARLAKIHEPWVRWRARPGEFGHGSMEPVRIILHDTEAHDAPGVTEIEGVANNWMKVPLDQDRLGAHFIVDGDGNIGQCGDPDELLYHIGGLNTGSVGIEQIGFATFTEKHWLDRQDQMVSVAKLLAWLHQEYRIPLEIPPHQGQGLAMHGVMTHAMVSRFEPKAMGHTDPGAGYPTSHVIAMAKGYVRAGGWPRPGQVEPSKPGAGGGARPGDGRKPKKKDVVVRGGSKLEVIGHTSGVKRYVGNPGHWPAIRRALQSGGHLHFDKEGTK